MAARDQLQVTRFGAVRGRPLFCLHGFLGRGDDWAGFCERLGPAYRVCAPDLPGHGASWPCGASALTFDGAVRTLSTLAGSRAQAWMGYSMGGRLALAAALHRPAGVRCLVVVSGWPGCESASEAQARAHRDDALADRLLAIGPARFLREWYTQPLFRSLGDRPGLKTRLLQERSAASAQGLAAALRGLTVGRQPSLWALLPGLTCPVLFVAGARDHRYAEALGRAAGLCRHGRLLIVPDSGHMPHLEHPDFFAAQVREFLDQHTG